MWRRISQAKAAGVEGNLKEKEGSLGRFCWWEEVKVELKWIRTEKSFGDHATNEEILKSYNNQENKRAAIFSNIRLYK